MRIRWSAEGPVRDVARVIEREAAFWVVEDHLECDYQQWRVVSADAVRMAVVRIEEHELVWIVSWQSEEFVCTRNSKYALFTCGWASAQPGQNWLASAAGMSP